MKHLIICIGISGSGKSSWSEDFLKRNSNYLRINRDDIRRVLVKDLVPYYTRKDVRYLEKIVTKVEHELFLALNDNNRSIVLDNTNLKLNTIESWINIAEQYHYDISFKFFDCKLRDAQSRVMCRDYDAENHPIERVKYIEKQFQQYDGIKKIITDRFEDKIL